MSNDEGREIASVAEVIRPDEGPVLKTGGGAEPLVGSSPTASASEEGTSSRGQWSGAMSTASEVFETVP